MEKSCRCLAKDASASLGMTAKIDFQNSFLEKWEYLTILLAVPILAFGTWWPVDFLNNRLDKAALIE